MNARFNFIKLNDEYTLTVFAKLLLFSRVAGFVIAMLDDGRVYARFPCSHAISRFARIRAIRFLLVTFARTIPTD